MKLTLDLTDAENAELIMVCARSMGLTGKVLRAMADAVAARDRPPAFVDTAYRVEPPTSEAERWASYTSSDPLGGLRAGAKAMHEHRGVWPTHIRLDAQTWMDLRHHPDVVRAAGRDRSLAVHTDDFGEALGMPWLRVCVEPFDGDERDCTFLFSRKERA